MKKIIEEIYNPGGFELGRRNMGIAITNPDGSTEKYDREQDLPPRIIDIFPHRRQVLNIHVYPPKLGAKIRAQDEVIVGDTWIPVGLPTQEVLRRHGLTLRLKDKTVLRGT